MYRYRNPFEEKKEWREMNRKEKFNHVMNEWILTGLAVSSVVGLFLVTLVGFIIMLVNGVFTYISNKGIATGTGEKMFMIAGSALASIIIGICVLERWNSNPCFLYLAEKN